jgi:predicted ArsR family transcriptional regulator
MLGISLYHLRKSLKELEQKHLIHIVRKGQGRPDTIYLNDFNSAIENPSSQHTIIEEKIKKEEEDETVSTEVAQQQQEKTDQTTGISQAQPSTTITPNPKHAPLTKTILNKIQTQIRPAGFEAFFKDVFVAGETDTEVEIFTPRGDQVAGWIKDHYLSMLKGVAGKQVTILSREAER